MPTIPTPPASLPKYLAEGLQKQDSETLKDVQEYATELRLYQAAQTGLDRPKAGDTTDNSADVANIADELLIKVRENEISEEVADWDEIVEKGVPARATLTTKTINDNQYYYFQWREGEQVKSQYVAPVTPKR
ncbi:hypothetical protein [Haladaptatus halobius]|uniref:hypothetical protein n=1 Tax=Haladaptatus halobius TaxID=2884875 RepID=UPI001D0BBC24|nr:hypothetical protein [Haladaptatus halobius]